MAHWTTSVRVFDKVCDCVPLLSTLTNGAELLYRLAHKVQNLAFFITPGLKTEIKIHVLNKDRLDLYMGLIPFLGNLYHIYELFSAYWTNPLEQAVRSQNAETIRLCLANGHLVRANSGTLDLAARCCDDEAFDLILRAREWSFEALSQALGGTYIAGWDRGPVYRAERLLDPYAASLSEQPEEDRIDSVINLLYKFTEFSQPHCESIVNRLLALLPPCRFSKLERLLENFSFPYDQYWDPTDLPSYCPGLYQEVGAAVLRKCTECSLGPFTGYASWVSEKRNRLSLNVQHNPNRAEILRKHDQVQAEILDTLWALISDQQSSEDIVDALDTATWDTTDPSLFEKLLTRFHTQVSVEDKHAIVYAFISESRQFEQASGLKVFELLLRYCQDAFPPGRPYPKLFEHIRNSSSDEYLELFLKMYPESRLAELKAAAV